MNIPIIIFIAVVQGILFLAHFIVYKSVIFFAGIESKGIMVTRLAFLALSLFFTIGSLITAQGFSLAGRTVYTMAAVWLGILFWLMSGAVIALILWNLGGIIFPSLSGLIWAKKAFGLLFLLIVIAINIYGLIHAQKITTNHYEISLPNLPSYWQGKKAVFIADTHFGNIWNIATARKTVKQIEALKPDIIFISGDFYDGPEINFSEVAEEFRALARKTPHGIYYVTGNHEEYRPKEQYLKPLRDAGIIVLENEIRTVEGLRIVGMNYGDSMNPIKQNEILSKLLTSQSGSNEKTEATLPGGPIIFLKHVPTSLDSAFVYGIDLQLSGHTHRGQIWPFSLLTKVIYKGYEFGLHDFSGQISDPLNQSTSTKKLQVLTTSGAGSWGPPQRVGTDSEIVEILFK